MSRVLHVATAAVVKVSLGANGGNRVARFVQRGDLLPEGLDAEQLTRLEQRGLIEALPSDEDLAEVLEEERLAQEAEAKAQFDQAVDIAAAKLVAERDAAAAKAAAVPSTPVTKPGTK